MNIILIGFMGSGKTAVGKELAAKLGMDFLDTDELIEKTEKRSITSIFQEYGEPYFRKLETETLKTLQDYDNYVLSTGGGIVLKEENAARLKELGKVIWLWAEPEVIHERIKHETHRPLLKVADPKAEIKNILLVRLPFYKSAADHRIDTTERPPHQVAMEIIEWLKLK